MVSLAYKSPNQTKSVELSYKGEIHFGPAFFEFSFIGFDVNNKWRYIGQDIHWSKNSIFVVILVFSSIISSEPPDYSLVIINTCDCSYEYIEKNIEKNIEMVGFEGDYYIYKVKVGDKYLEKHFKVK